MFVYVIIYLFILINKSLFYYELLYYKIIERQENIEEIIKEYYKNQEKFVYLRFSTIISKKIHNKKL